MHKNKQKPCRFFVVSGGGPGLLGIPDVEILELQSVNSNTLEPSWKSRQISGQTKQDKSLLYKSFVNKD